MPTSTRSGSVNTDVSPPAPKPRSSRTATIVRVHEVVDRVVVEHEAPPVITEAEARVIKTTTMQRGKPGLPRPQSAGASSETRTTRRRAAGAANAEMGVLVEAGGQQQEQQEGAPRETRAPTLEIEEVVGGEEEGAPDGGLMSTQELLTEAEGILAEPMPPDTAAQGEQAGGGQEPRDGADAAERAEAAARQAAEEARGAQAAEAEAARAADEAEEEAAAASAGEEGTGAASGRAASSGAGIMGRVTGLLHNILHPGQPTLQARSDAGDGQGAPVESTESAQGQVPDCVEEPPEEEPLLPPTEQQEPEAPPAAKEAEPEAPAAVAAAPAKRGHGRPAKGAKKPSATASGERFDAEAAKQSENVHLHGVDPMEMETGEEPSLANEEPAPEVQAALDRAPKKAAPPKKTKAAAAGRKKAAAPQEPAPEPEAEEQGAAQQPEEQEGERNATPEQMAEPMQTRATPKRRQTDAGKTDAAPAAKRPRGQLDFEQKQDNGKGAGKKRAAPAKAAPPAKKAKQEPAPEKAPAKAPAKKAPAKTAPAKTGRAGAAAKAPRKTVPSAKRAPVSRRHETYKTYIFIVLKEIHPNASISSKAMEVMNNFMEDMFARIANEAARLLRISNKETLSSREMNTAVRLLLEGQLAQHAMAEGAKAVNAALS